ncbi:MAG: ATP-grasp domain-containing protein [Egibacteraceae bacterium]
MADDSGVVLVIGSAAQQYREYLLSGASQRRQLWLLDGVESTWQRPYVVGTSVVELLDRDRLILDQPQLVDTAVRLAEQRQVAGVFTYDETLVIATAHIAEALGLPGMTIDGADRCRDKHRTRQTLTEAGLPQPRFAMATTLEEARVAAGAMGYPLVLKPRGIGASIGVVRADTAAELDTAFAVAERASHRGSPSYEDGVLVEELLTGPEISIDGAIFDGEYCPFFLARKHVGLAPYFEEVGHVLSADDPLLDDPELAKVLIEAHDALGVRYGITHTEVLLTERGPAIVEVNGRLGGDLIPYLGKLATGIDPGHIAVDVATGMRPVIRPAKTGSVGIRFLYPPQDCRIRSVSLPEPRTRAGLLEAHAMAEPGTLLRLPPRAHVGRYAYLICAADDPDTCNTRLNAAASLAALSYDDAEDDSPPS